MPARGPNDLTDLQFNDLTALVCNGRKTSNAEWLCRCKCGTELRLLAKTIREGLVKRCGPCTVAMDRDKAPFPLTLGPSCDECGEKRMVMMHTEYGCVYCGKCYVQSLRAMEGQG